MLGRNCALFREHGAIVLLKSMRRYTASKHLGCGEPTLTATMFPWKMKTSIWTQGRHYIMFLFLCGIYLLPEIICARENKLQQVMNLQCIWQQGCVSSIQSVFCNMAIFGLQIWGCRIRYAPMGWQHGIVSGNLLAIQGSVSGWLWF